MKKEAKEWMKKSREDMGTASYTLKGRKLNAAVFFAQQAAEKSLKALQIEKLGRFDRIHDLLALAKTVNAPENIIGCCTAINPFYTITRYPDSEERLSKKEAASLVKKAKEVVEWAEQSLKQ